MPHDPQRPDVLDYAKPERQRGLAALRVFAWLMPLWCALIIAAAHKDDEFWYAATGFALASSYYCWLRTRRGLAVYCFTTALGVLATGALLPNFMR